ncbi:SLC4A1AP (predicted) [Pycnogonum litorale]
MYTFSYLTRKVTTDVDKKSISVASSGFYLYDLGSTHGSFLNKTRIESKVYHRLHVGHMMKFGGSSRMYILQGPCEDQERESELSVSELIQMGKKRQSIQSIDDDGELTEKNHGDDNDATDNKPGAANKTDEGIDWGLAEDADEEQDLSENPFAISTANEELYLDDPKKTLRGFFEREGSELEYKVEEKGYSHFVCRVELPLDSATGHPIIAEATAKGKKKEAVVQCALEACRILDRHGVLRQAKHGMFTWSYFS